MEHETNDRTKLEPETPNYKNARGNFTTKIDSSGDPDASPGVSPGAVPDNKSDEKALRQRASSRTSNAEEEMSYHDGNYATFMNRGGGRYGDIIPGKDEGSFGPYKDHDGLTERVYPEK